MISLVHSGGLQGCAALRKNKEFAEQFLSNTITIFTYCCLKILKAAPWGPKCFNPAGMLFIRGACCNDSKSKLHLLRTIDNCFLLTKAMDKSCPSPPMSARHREVVHSIQPQRASVCADCFAGCFPSWNMLRRQSSLNLLTPFCTCL